MLLRLDPGKDLASSREQVVNSSYYGITDYAHHLVSCIGRYKKDHSTGPVS